MLADCDDEGKIAPLGGEAYLDEMMGRLLPMCFPKFHLPRRCSCFLDEHLRGVNPFGKRLTHLSQILGIMNKERAMTKTLVALALIAGGILLVTRLVDTDKPMPARLSPPTSADQMSEARRVSPTMSARDVCNLIDPWQKCSFSKPNIMVVDPKIGTQVAAVSLCNEFVVAVRGMNKVGEPMEPGWTLHVHSSKGELASCYLP